MVKLLWILCGWMFNILLKYTYVVITYKLYYCVFWPHEKNKKRIADCIPV